MRKIVLRTGKWIGGTLVVLVALVLITAGIVLNTSAGGRALLYFLPRLSVDVSVADFHGRLAGSFTMTGIAYHAEEIDFAVDNLEV